MNKITLSLVFLLVNSSRILPCSIGHALPMSYRHTANHTVPVSMLDSLLRPYEKSRPDYFLQQSRSLEQKQKWIGDTIRVWDFNNKCRLHENFPLGLKILELDGKIIGIKTCDSVCDGQNVLIAFEIMGIWRVYFCNNEASKYLGSYNEVFFSYLSGTSYLFVGRIDGVDHIVTEEGEIGAIVAESIF